MHYFDHGHGCLHNGVSGRISKSGDHLIAFHDIYGAHYKVFLDLGAYGASKSPGSTPTITARCPITSSQNTKNDLLRDAPPNPLCKTVDIRLSQQGGEKKPGAMLIVDKHVFPPHIIRKPLEMGRRPWLVHSATKGLGGHKRPDGRCDLQARRDHYNETLVYPTGHRKPRSTPIPLRFLSVGLKSFELRAETDGVERAKRWPNFLAQQDKNIPHHFTPALETDCRTRK